MYDKPGLAQASQIGGTRAMVPDDTTLGQRMSDTHQSLVELRLQLSNLNRRLRGSVPENGAEGSNKEPETSLIYFAAKTTMLVEQCHAELQEAFRVIG
jgi:hypothetical protein